MSFYKSLINEYSHKNPNLSIAINGTIHCPLSIRKVIVNQCQTQEFERSDFQDFDFPPLRYPISNQLVSVELFLTSISIVLQSSVSSSILWICARTCPEPLDNDESEQVRTEGFFKELHAGQTIRSSSQRVSYSAFFRNHPGINDPGQWWVSQAHEIADDFFTSVGKLKAIFPHVNRTKGVSDETAFLYNSIADTYLPHVRTADLEVLHHHTGHKIQGATELRSAWKFNNLKPRYYYALGGDHYWSSRYMKKIAVALMESIPSTFQKLRSYPPDFINADLETEDVIYWDFSSFTTRLSELKYFLWNIARLAEKRGTKVTVFDYRLGFHEQFLHEMLDEYNQVVNMTMSYAIHRFVGKYMGEAEDIFMMNSGPLGVAGNIGFSTALHGFVLCRECGKKRCVCVGDDALGVTTNETETLYPALDAIGDLNPTKIGVLLRGDDESYGRFLKRRLQRVGNFLSLSFLFCFPIPAYIDGRGSHRTLPLDFSLEARVHKFISQAAVVLWDLLEHPVSSVSTQAAMNYLAVGYRAFGLPMTGRLCGAKVHLTEQSDPMDTVTLSLSLPRLVDLNPCVDDWLEHLIRNPPDQFFRMPVYGIDCTADFQGMMPGESIVATTSSWLLAMEDCGYYHVERMSTWVKVEMEGSNRLLKRMFNRDVDHEMSRMNYVTCRERPPVYLFAVQAEKECFDRDVIMEDL